MFAPTSLKPRIAARHPMAGGRRDMVRARVAQTCHRLSAWIALMPVIGISGTLIALCMIVARTIVERAR